MDTGRTTIRNMEAGEAEALFNKAKQCFRPSEIFGVSKPELAVVAEAGGEIAGAMFLKIIETKGKRSGYLELGFVMKERRGSGVGNILYPAAIRRLRELGCDSITAMVKDDNVASWGLLKKHGFVMVTFAGMLRRLGIVHSLAVWFKTIYCVTCGMNLWISGPGPGQEQTDAGEAALFYASNLLFMALRLLFVFILSGGLRYQETLAGLLALTVSVAGGFIGSRISGGKWRFRLNRGGALLSAIFMAMGTFFPMLGRWYPASYENTPKQRRELGICALAEWMSILALLSVYVFLAPAGDFRGHSLRILTVFLVYHLIAVFPFEYFGGGRVFEWSKPVFFILAAITVILIYLPILA